MPSFLLTVLCTLNRHESASASMARKGFLPPSDVSDGNGGEGDASSPKFGASWTRIAAAISSEMTILVARWDGFIWVHRDGYLVF